VHPAGSGHLRISHGANTSNCELALAQEQIQQWQTTDPRFCVPEPRIEKRGNARTAAAGKTQPSRRRVSHGLQENKVYNTTWTYRPGCNHAHDVVGTVDSISTKTALRPGVFKGETWEGPFSCSVASGMLLCPNSLKVYVSHRRRWRSTSLLFAGG